MTAPALPTPQGPYAHRIVPIVGYEGLGECVVCMSAEGEIPTDCPGRPMTAEERSSVFDGTLDYRKGVWTVLEHKP